MEKGYDGSRSSNRPWFLQVNVVNIENNFPVQNAKISVSRTDAPLRPLEQADTDRSGQTPEISLEAPPVEYSLDPESGIRPYAEYNLEITAPGLKPSGLTELRFWQIPLPFSPFGWSRKPILLP